MKFCHRLIKYTSILLLMHFCVGNIISAQVVTYPAPPGLITSSDFTMKVNNTPVWVEKIGSKLKSFDYTIGLYGGREMEDLNAACFSFSGKVTITITEIGRALCRER